MQPIFSGQTVCGPEASLQRQRALV